MSDLNVNHTVIGILSAIPYFADLDKAALETIARSTVQQDYTTGQIVFLEGEECIGLYIVHEGWLKVVKLSSAGREQILHFVGPGETFNEISVLADVPNPATVIALEATSVSIVPRDIVLQLIDEHAGLARVIIQSLAGRLLNLVGLVEDLSLRSVEARLARVLLENASEGVLQRRRWATQAEMAARLGTVPDVLSRVLRGLVEAGLVQIERREIRILDPAGLEARARSDN